MSSKKASYGWNGRLEYYVWMVWGEKPPILDWERGMLEGAVYWTRETKHVDLERQMLWDEGYSISERI